MTTARGDAVYTRMVAMVTRLLTDFGQTMTRQRITRTFDAATQRPTATSSATASIIGAVSQLQVNPVDGTRIELDQRILVVDADADIAMSDRILTTEYGTGWTVEKVQTINPGGTVLAQIITVRK